MRSLFESGHRPNRPPKSEGPKRFEDPKWVQKMTLILDHNYAMAEFLGGAGLTDTDLSDLSPRLKALDQGLVAARQSGQAAFLDLPHQTLVIKEIRQLAKPLLEWCWDLVVLGAGGEASGVRALHQALLPPQHNKFPMARRHHKLGLWVADTIDPDYFWGLLDGLDLRRACFNVISTSGDTPETLAQFLWVYNLLKNRFGEDKAKERLVITTAADTGPLQSLASRQRFPSLAVPAMAGPFAVLSAAGLLPAYLCGIDVEELLAGARALDHRLQDATPDTNPAYRLAALFYLFAATRKRPLLVCLPYAGALAGLAEWFCELWTATLGRVPAASTPVWAPRLYPEGPDDKLTIFLAADKFQQPLEIPDSYPESVAVSSLGGQSFEELLQATRQAAAFQLMNAGRPNLTLHLPEINPFTIGQLLYLLEVATVAAAHLFGVKVGDLWGGSQKTVSGPGGREFADAPPALEKYRIT
jgi:glucose-6-phosphate isomerase